jgi:thymidylate synthase
MQQYPDLPADVIENGTDKGDRTGTGTRSVYGYKCTIDGGKTWAYSLTKKCRYCLPVYNEQEVLDGQPV